MSEPAMKFFDFIKIDPTYQQLVAAWLAENRCPVGLADHLLENGYESHAMAAYWAASADAKYWAEGGELQGPRPATGKEIKKDDPHEQYLSDVDWYFIGSWPCLRPWHYPSQMTVSGHTAEEAIANLLQSIKIRKFDVTTNFQPRASY